jgi:hypothetical protein
MLADLSEANYPTDGWVGLIISALRPEVRKMARLLGPFENSMALLNHADKIDLYGQEEGATLWSKSPAAELNAIDLHNSHLLEEMAIIKEKLNDLALNSSTH